MDEELKELIEASYLAAEDFERTLDAEELEHDLMQLKEAHTSLLTEEEEDQLLSAIYTLENALNEFES